MSFGSQKSTAPANPNNAVSMGQSSAANRGSTSASQDPSTVWGPQAGYLQQLFSQGNNLAQNFGQYQQQGQGVFDTALSGFDRLMNPGVNPQLGAYSGEVQRNLTDNLLPTIGGQSQGFGQFGGSRQGVAEGVAVGQANQDITNMASNLYSQDMDRMLQAGSMAPGLANMGMGIPWYAMNQYAGLLGDPTVLSGGGRSSSTSSGGSQSTNFSRDIGGGGGGGGGGWNIGLGALI